MKFLYIILLTLITVGSNNMHQDRILEIDEDGNIIGLPEEYCPAKFDIGKNYLKINDKELRFPNCINYYFNIHDKPKLRLSASWYHSKETLPYYLNFDISQKNKDYGYSILVDLETLELIHINVSIKKGNSIYNHEIKIDERCVSDYETKLKRLVK